MFSSSVLNSTARCSSPVHYHHPHHQHLQQPTYSDIFSDHSSYISGCFFHHPNPLAGTTVVQDADIGMSRFTTNAPSFENTPMYMMPQSAAVVASKKSDNRSKIRTAQGLRDRRVRLSINIARKFFDLQDLLGFDKPSGTLEWLLNNSNKAILELAAVSSSSTSSEATRTGDGYNSLSSSWTNQADQRMSCNASLETMKQKEALLARESRAKARARARARTVAKLCTPKLNHQRNRLLNNPEDKSSSANCHNFSKPSLMKSLVAESHEEEREQGEEQHKQNPQLQLHNYDSGMKSNYYWSGLNPNMPLDIIPPTSSSLAHQLNLSRDFDINGRGSWDYLLGNYTTL